MKENISPYSDEIIDAFKHIGWALYYRSESMSESEVTQVGPAQELILDQGYMLLPLLDGKDAYNSAKVQSALEEVAVMLNRDISKLRILLEGMPVAFLGLTPREENVELHTQMGDSVDYSALITAIPTFFDRSSLDK